MVTASRVLSLQSPNRRFRTAEGGGGRVGSGSHLDPHVANLLLHKTKHGQQALQVLFIRLCHRFAACPKMKRSSTDTEQAR